MSDYISQDVFGLIFKRLSAKTLLTSRCVCRSWKQLIDSESFILDHLSFQRSRIIVQNQNFEYLLLDPFTLPSYLTLKGPYGVQTTGKCHTLSVASSVHGVICLCDRGGGDVVTLWNPSIGKLMSIPLPNFLSGDLDSKYCGFWIDLSSHDFKIVILSFSKRQSIALYSSTKQTWSVIALESRYMGTGNEVPQVLIDGVAHWLASTVGKLVIVTFDFRKDIFGTIEVPKLLDVGMEQESYFQYDKNVCKWKDSLSFVYMQDETSTCHLWAMRNGSWSKISTLNLMNDIVEVFCVFENWGRVLAATRKGDLVLYDDKDGCFPLDSNFMRQGFFFFAMDHVAESLVFPDGKCISSGSL